jgi:hypothetical protein
VEKIGNKAGREFKISSIHKNDTYEYFIFGHEILSGPFTLDELKAKKITKTTSVWCEGMEDWNTAGSVES